MLSSTAALAEVLCGVPAPDGQAASWGCLHWVLCRSSPRVLSQAEFRGLQSQPQGWQVVNPDSGGRSECKPPCNARCCEGHEDEIDPKTVWTAAKPYAGLATNRGGGQGQGGAQQCRVLGFGRAKLVHYPHRFSMHVKQSAKDSNCLVGVASAQFGGIGASPGNEVDIPSEGWFSPLGQVCCALHWPAHRHLRKVLGVRQRECNVECVSRMVCGIWHPQH